jgi:hypothetical protein
LLFFFSSSKKAKIFWNVLEFIYLGLNSKVNKKPLLKRFSVLEMKLGYLINSQK